MYLVGIKNALSLLSVHRKIKIRIERHVLCVEKSEDTFARFLT